MLQFEKHSWVQSWGKKISKNKNDFKIEKINKWSALHEFRWKIFAIQLRILFFRFPTFNITYQFFMKRALEL